MAPRHLLLHKVLPPLSALCLASILPLSALALEWRDNLRAKLDASSRAVHASDLAETGFQHAFGLDMHKVFSGDKGDIGTLILQGYITRINNMQRRPGFFEHPDDTEFVYRIFNFNYTGLGRKLPNIRVGHLEIPYGLEATIPSNGTLRQYQLPRNIGIKADWGFGLNKQHTGFEYDVSLTSGGGQQIERRDGSYVFAARVGTPRDENLSVGVSVYKSELNGLVRERVGVDARYYRGLIGWFAELSAGENAGNDIFNGLLEWNRRNARENTLLYLQLAYFSEAGALRETATQAIAGIKYEPTNSLTLSAQAVTDVDTYRSAESKNTLSVQVRYRF